MLAGLFLPVCVAYTIHYLLRYSVVLYDLEREMGHIIESLLVAAALAAVVFFFGTFYDSAYPTLTDGKNKKPAIIGWTIGTFVVVILIGLFGGKSA